MAALGPSATGFFAENRLRYKWKVSRPDLLIEKLSPESARMERFYSALRLAEGPALENFFHRDSLSRVVALVEGLVRAREGEGRGGEGTPQFQGFFFPWMA